MKNNIFSTSYGSFPVSHIVYASGVWEIPAEKRKNDRTHAFKIVTTVDAAFCFFKGFDAAVNARNALGAMIMSTTPHAFRHGNEVIDARRIVSIGAVVALKTPQGDYTHAVIATLDTRDERNGKVWLRYKSEENAKKGRWALHAVVAAANGAELSDDQNDSGKAEEEVKAEAVAETVTPSNDQDLPF